MSRKKADTNLESEHADRMTYINDVIYTSLEMARNAYQVLLCILFIAHNVSTVCVVQFFDNLQVSYTKSNLNFLV